MSVAGLLFCTQSFRKSAVSIEVKDLLKENGNVFLIFDFNIAHYINSFKFYITKYEIFVDVSFKI